VLYSLACVKQWGGKNVSPYFGSLRCINVFTHNSLRNKGNSLTAIAGHVEPSISRKLDVVVG